jgi:hypothetical protein
MGSAQSRDLTLAGQNAFRGRYTAPPFRQPKSALRFRRTRFTLPAQNSLRNFPLRRSET